MPTGPPLPTSPPNFGGEVTRADAPTLAPTGESTLGLLEGGG